MYEENIQDNECDGTFFEEKESMLLENNILKTIKESYFYNDCYCFTICFIKIIK